METAAFQLQAAAKTNVGTADGSHGKRAPRIFFWLLVAAITALGVFVLPFAFPPKLPTWSASYTYGYSNRVAGLAAAGMGTVVLCLLWIFQICEFPLLDRERQPGRNPAEALSRKWLAVACSVVIAFTEWFGGTFVHSNYYYDDASYIMNQLGRAIRDHAVLYRDFNWPYGPILFHWPEYTARLLAHAGISLGASYMITDAIQQAIGIGFLFYLLNWLPLSRKLRAAAFALFSLGTITPILGLNYTLFRFLFAHTLFVAITECPTLPLQAGLFAVSEVLCLGISPELGAAFLVGAGCYSLYRAFTVKWTWAIVCIAPLLGFTIFSLIEGKSYFRVMASFANGAFNTVIAPDFPVALLLIATVALCPLALAPYLRTQNPRAPALLGLYFVSLVLLGPAMGRCDPLHVFFDGLGVLLLSLLAVQRMRTLTQGVWVALLCILIFLHLDSKIHDFRPLLQVMFKGPTDQDGVDMARLEALTDGKPVATPIKAPQRVTQELIRRGQYLPSRYAFMGEVWDRAAEEHKIAEMRQAPFALIPDANFVWEYGPPDPRRRIRIFRLGYNYHKRFQPWLIGALITNELDDNWTAVGSVGTYTVYRRNDWRPGNP